LLEKFCGKEPGKEKVVGKSREKKREASNHPV